MTRQQRRRTPKGASRVGERYEAEVGAVAHGGHCVARVDDQGTGGQRVVFVRHTLPGERVVLEITEGTDGDRFWRADAVEILAAAAGRVSAPCSVAGPGLCGGCDFQHVALPVQRELKAAVVREQLVRLGRRDVDDPVVAGLVVEAVPGDQEGLRWRTRVRWATTHDGRRGLRAHRSHRVIPVEDCLIALPTPAETSPLVGEASGLGGEGSGLGGEGSGPGGEASGPGVSTSSTNRLGVSTGSTNRVGVSTGSGGEVLELVEITRPQPGAHQFARASDGFWQVHPGAPVVLVEAVLDALSPRPGERVLDLYAGVGLFAAFLADQVLPAGHVTAIEGDSTAAQHATANLGGRVTVIAREVASALRDGAPETVDLVVMDPPRQGAKAEVVRAVVAREPRAVAYVACDPAALARDLATFADLGYQLTRLRGFDLFPMTHHVECVALLERTGSDLR